jgi:hypothetical protein
MFSLGKMANCQRDWPVNPLVTFSQGKMVNCQGDWPVDPLAMFSQGKMVNCQGDWPVDPLAMFSQGKMAVYWRIGRLAAPIIWPELRPGLAMGSQPCFLAKNLAFTDYRKGVFATEGEENTESFSVNASPSVVIYCPQAQASLVPLKKRREIEEQRGFLSGSLLLCPSVFVFFGKVNLQPRTRPIAP